MRPLEDLKSYFYIILSPVAWTHPQVATSTFILFYCSLLLPLSTYLQGWQQGVLAGWGLLYPASTPMRRLGGGTWTPWNNTTSLIILLPTQFILFIKILSYFITPWIVDARDEFYLQILPITQQIKFTYGFYERALLFDYPTYSIILFLHIVFQFTRTLLICLMYWSNQMYMQ